MPTVSASTQSSQSHVPPNSIEPGVSPALKRRHGSKPGELDLLRLACRLPHLQTKVAAREALQRSGFTASPVFVDALLEQVQQLHKLRGERMHRRILQRLGHIPADSTLRGAPRQRPVLLPSGTPGTRLQDLRERDVTRHAKALLRHGASGGNSFRVSFATTESAVGYEVKMGTNWDTYRGRFKGWAANEDHHHICVPKDWRLRVMRQGLASLGGMLTLDAHRLVAPDGIRLYAATWARQGRGYAAQVERGYIALLGTEHFHAESPEAAIQGVRRKARLASDASQGSSVERFIRKYMHLDLYVTLDDARDSGSCEFGIHSWCESTGLDYAQGQASLQQVLQGFRKRPQIEVRRAVILAVRRHQDRKTEMAG